METKSSWLSKSKEVVDRPGPAAAERDDQACERRQAHAHGGDREQVPDVSGHGRRLRQAPWADTLEIYESDFKLPPGTVLPDSADLSPWFPPAGNQGRQYACTAWAFAYGLMTFRDNFRQWCAPDKDAPVHPARAYSPAFIFNLVIPFGIWTPPNVDIVFCRVLILSCVVWILVAKNA